MLSTNSWCLESSVELAIMFLGVLVCSFAFESVVDVADVSWRLFRTGNTRHVVMTGDTRHAESNKKVNRKKLTQIHEKEHYYRRPAKVLLVILL
jgi:hypothetical protein